MACSCCCLFYRRSLGGPVVPQLGPHKGPRAPPRPPPRPPPGPKKPSPGLPRPPPAPPDLPKTHKIPKTFKPPNLLLGRRGESQYIYICIY